MSGRTSLAIQKAKARRELKHRWNLWAGEPPNFNFLKERLQDNLRWWLSRHPGVWGSYRPLPLEADPGLGDLPGIEWVYPRIDGDHLVYARGDQFEMHRWGMEEPVASASLVDMSKLTGILVPALGFDRFGARLGRGAGFYDRTLRGLEDSFRGLKVGVAYGFQIRDLIPSEAHDVRMDVIVTDQTVIECGGI